ncbi:MAG: sulfotransferase, partial [Planctomycetota bacterium]
MNLVRNLARKVQRMARRPKQRVFGIGLNKTGTTSLATALQQLGFDVAPQEPFEALFDDWAARRFDRIIRLCRRWQAFQDIPFSLPFTFQALDAAYPGSLFVQTVRTTEEQWLSSLLRYHAV